MDTKHKQLVVGGLAIAAFALITWLALPEDSKSVVKEILGIAQGTQPAPSRPQGQTLDQLLTSWGKDTRTVINGHPVPPVPDPKLNAATLAGVDSDNNGIRDDLDRYIADKFGDNLKYYENVVIAEKTETNALLNPTPANVENAIREGSCAMFYSGVDYHKSASQLDELTRKANSIGGRGGVYARTFAGADANLNCKRK